MIHSVMCNETFYVQRCGQMYEITLKKITYEYGWRIAPDLRAWNAAQNCSIKGKRTVAKRTGKSIEKIPKNLTKEQVIETLMRSGCPWSR